MSNAMAPAIEPGSSSGTDPPPPPPSSAPPPPPLPPPPPPPPSLSPPPPLPPPPLPPLVGGGFVDGKKACAVSAKTSRPSATANMQDRVLGCRNMCRSVRWYRISKFPRGQRPQPGLRMFPPIEPSHLNIRK